MTTYLRMIRLLVLGYLINAENLYWEIPRWNPDTHMEDYDIGEPLTGEEISIYKASMRQ